MEKEPIKLTHGAITYLNNYHIVKNKTLLNVKFILQIYKCHIIINKVEDDKDNECYACTLLDDECLCNNFILKYNKKKGKLYNKDIIYISNISINILPDKKHLSYVCSEIKILKRVDNFLFNPNSLKRASTTINKTNMKLEEDDTKFNIKIIHKKKKEEFYLDLKDEEISKVIKFLILIVIDEQNNSMKDSNKEYKKCFLINKLFLKEYISEYKKVKNLINNNIESIITDIENINDNKLPYNKKYLDNIISKLDLKTITEIDNKIKQKEKNIDITLNPNIQKINLIDKQITIYQDYLLLNENIFEYLKNIYDSLNQDFIYYLGNKNNEIITFEKDNKYIIILMNNNNIKYILDFYSYDVYKKEKNILLNYNFDNYIKDKTVFIYDKISPIFSKNDVIGYCYKYTSDIDYSSIINYYDYLSEENFINSINLYFNYQRIYNKLYLKDKKLSIEKYYLINKDYLKEIKNVYNFNIINKILIENNIIENDDNYIKKLLSIVKKLSNEDLHKIRKNNKVNIKFSIEPNITTFNYFNKTKKYVMLYNNFELIQDNIVQKINIIKGNKNNDYILESIITEGKIILNYNNNLNKDVYVSVIGILNDENIFIIEFVLIYKNENEQKKHIFNISNNLVNYLKGLQLYNNSQPIIGDNYKEIGILIKNNISYIKNNFNTPPKIGLENIGATCYMNATLQCFCHIEKLINFFKSSKQVNDFKNKKETLSYSFKLLIDELWPNNYNNLTHKKTSYAPYDFKKKISKMNPLFQGIAANDAKDLVNFIIMTLHEELNKAKTNIVTYDVMNIDQTNKLLMFNNFAKFFIIHNQSIISDLFYAINYTITECFLCHTKLYNYQIYFFIVFPLEEVRKFKYNNIYNFNFNFINNSNVVNIYDCFDYDKKMNLMSGANAIYCNFCKINCDASMTSYLCTGPEILILLLNRGKGIEFNVKMTFDENLNLYNYIELKETGYNYQLIGVITHIGESSMSGHFIAYCKDPIDEKWYKYNDSIVTEVNNFYKEVIDFAMPYLLFYKKI